jgi:hypothetical protein
MPGASVQITKREHAVCGRWDSDNGLGIGLSTSDSAYANRREST